MPAFIEASQRPRYYSPLVSDGEPPLSHCGLLSFWGIREAACVLEARAMLFIGEGQLDAAWSDIVAIHRLARLLGQGPSVIHTVTSIGVDQMAYECETALAQSAKLSADQARRFEAELRRLGSLPRMADKVDAGLRFELLDAVGAYARGHADLVEMGGLIREEYDLAMGLLKQTPSNEIDWDEILIEGNRYYDRLVAALAKPDRQQRDAAVTEIIEEIERLATQAKDAKSMALDALKGAPTGDVVTRRVCHLLLAAFVIPSAEMVLWTDQREAIQRLPPIALALGGYRSEHGGYPEKLSALAPKYLDKLPVDPFTGKDMQYKRRGGGYLLYSVGRNGEDDEGRNCIMDWLTLEEPPEDYQGDDLAIKAGEKPSERKR